QCVYLYAAALNTLVSLVSSFIPVRVFFFFVNNPATTEIYTLSLHDALPILRRVSHMIAEAKPECELEVDGGIDETTAQLTVEARSEEHTSELQSLTNLVCRLLLEKQK